MRIVYSLVLVLLQPIIVLSFLPGAKVSSQQRQSPSSRHESENGMEDSLWTRQDIVSTLGGLLTSTMFSQVACADSPKSISACTKAQDSNAATNCVSTANVRQVDLYMPPWTFPSSMPLDEVMGRLKGAILTDIKLTVEEQSENYLRVSAIRNFATDELEFVVNPEERVIIFRSQQVDGPEISDFGSQRKRLEDLRRRIKVFGVMGEEYKQEGVLGQLKAFYGLQSGAGYEDVILDE